MSQVQDFVKSAKMQIGADYQYGADGPTAFDCSGLVRWAYRRATGKNITGSSHAQYQLGKPVKTEQIKPGDLVFYGQGNSADHVGIVTGKNETVHAFNEQLGVRKATFDPNPTGLKFLGARRIFDSPKKLTLVPLESGVPREAAGDVTRNTNFRNAGNTDRESFKRQLAKSVTPGRTPPPLAEADRIYDALEPHGLTRLAAAMAWIERSNETNDEDLGYYPRSFHNLWAVKNQRTGGWMQYESYEAAAHDWVGRVLGDTYKDQKSIADFIAKYAPWSDGNNPDQYGTKAVNLINTLPLLKAPAPPPGPTPPPGPGPTPPPSSDFKEWTIPGLGRIRLPKAITVEVDLTPVGVHRPGGVYQMSGYTIHETGNRGNGAGARMHSDWQDGSTQGHPDGYVGVTMYVENRLLMVKIPFNEQSIHAGDWRNHVHPSCEICVNADRNAEQTEDTAFWVAAATLHLRNQNPIDHLYPHRSAPGCPAIINSQGRWPQVEREVQKRIDILASGAPLPPAEEYAVPVPVPKVWDGLDYVREADGHRFVALSRVFVTKVVTAARQSADPKGKKVRKDLQPGEGFLSHYVTMGGDGKPWLVSQYGSRIAAEDCIPDLSALDLDEPDSMAFGIAAAGSWIPELADPSHGLDSAEVPLDAPALSKAEFMRSG